jgi:hypothetical protein
LVAISGRIREERDEDVDRVICCDCQLAVAGPGDGALREWPGVERDLAEGRDLGCC